MIVTQTSWLVFFCLLAFLIGGVNSSLNCLVDKQMDILWLLDLEAGQQDDAISSKLRFVLGSIADITQESISMGPFAVRQGLLYRGDPISGLSITDSETLFLSKLNGFINEQRSTNSKDLLIDRNEANNSPVVVYVTDRYDSSISHDDVRGNAVAVAREELGTLNEDRFFILHFRKSSGILHNSYELYTTDDLGSTQTLDLNKYLLCPLSKSLDLQTVPHFSSSSAIALPVSSAEDIEPSESCVSLGTEDVSVGQVCLIYTQDNVSLEYQLSEGWTLDAVQSWIGVNPTTLPYNNGGVPLVNQFPYQEQVTTIPFTSFQFTTLACDLYVLPSARVSSTTTEQELSVYAGDVPFSDQTSALIFKRSFASECAATRTPTIPTFPPIDTPTLAPTESPTSDRGQTSRPTSSPTRSPTFMGQTYSPTSFPTPTPTRSPTQSPTSTPTRSPTFTGQTYTPTTSPTRSPTQSPTSTPTKSPTFAGQTYAPTSSPTRSPTFTGQTYAPTSSPTRSPTFTGQTYAPTSSPTRSPTFTGQTYAPTSSPTRSPTFTGQTYAPTMPPVNFDVLVLFTNSVPEAYQKEIRAVAKAFEGVFSGDYASYTCFEPQQTFCSYTFTQRVCVDDILILVSVMDIDGRSGQLARAGPCVINRDLEQVRVAQLTIDASDIDQFISSDQFAPEITHELMHAIGFGTRWDIWGATNPENPGVYLGAKGIEGYRQLGGNGNPELAQTRIHWSKPVFGNELMTPSLSNGPNPLSIMSIMSLMDLGFRVNVSAAQPYQLPSLQSQPSRRRLQTFYQDILIFPYQYCDWTVKPNREADLAAELDFARIHIHSEYQSRSAPMKPSDIGILVGVLCAVLFLCALLGIVVYCRDEKKPSSGEKDLTHAFDEPHVTVKHESSSMGWHEYKDTDGRKYWLNDDTNEFSWVPPESFNRPDLQVPEGTYVRNRRKSSVTGKTMYVGGKNWREHTDDTGKTFWLNDAGEFSWVPPSELDSSSPSQQQYDRPRASSFASDRSGVGRAPPPIPGEQVVIELSDEDYTDGDEQFNDSVPDSETREYVTQGHSTDDTSNSVLANAAEPEVPRFDLEEFRDSFDEPDEMEQELQEESRQETEENLEEHTADEFEEHTEDEFDEFSDDEANYAPRSYLPVPPEEEATLNDSNEELEHVPRSYLPMPSPNQLRDDDDSPVENTVTAYTNADPDDA